MSMGCANRWSFCTMGIQPMALFGIMPVSYRDEAGRSGCIVLGPHRRSSWTMGLQSTALLASLADRAMRSWRSAMSTATRTPVRPMPACLLNLVQLHSSNCVLTFDPQ